MAKKALTAEEKAAREKAAQIKKQERVSKMTPEEKALFEQKEALQKKLDDIRKAKSVARKAEREDESSNVSWAVFRTVLASLKNGEEFAVKLLRKVANDTPDADVKAAIGRIVERNSKK